MVIHVSSLRRTQNKVGEHVVRRITILVMHYLRRFQWTANRLLHDKTMFKYILAIDSNHSTAVRASRSVSPAGVACSDTPDTPAFTTAVFCLRSMFPTAENTERLMARWANDIRESRAVRPLSHNLHVLFSRMGIVQQVL
jgi:hypothetical protein